MLPVDFRYGHLLSSLPAGVKCPPLQSTQCVKLSFPLKNNKLYENSLNEKYLIEVEEEKE
jgi:hypothetical protein